MKGEGQNKTPIKHVLSTKLQFLTNTDYFFAIFSLSSISINSGNSQELFSCFISYPMILLSALKVCQETQLFKLFPIRKENLKIMFPFKLYIWGKVNWELLNEIGQFLTKDGIKIKIIADLKQIQVNRIKSNAIIHVQFSQM